MIVMEGLMLVPPERGTIIGKPAWKTRYIVLGTGATLKTQNDLLPSSGSTRGSDGRKGSKVISSKPSLVDVSQPGPTGTALYITVYKAKGDWEFIAQHPVSAFKSCNIQTLQYRKQSPSMPTLMFEMKSDSLSEKQRKRKSSRTGALSAKDPWANFLLFRTVPTEKHGVYEWQAAVRPLLTPEEPAEEVIMTPKSPAFSAFVYPFGRTRRASSATSRISETDRRSSSVQGHPNFYPHTPVVRERPSAMISPTPSLRSRRSDLSSQASSQPPHMGSTSAHLPHGYNGTLPVDMPSPDSMSGYENQLIEGWTSAQGRSSALSSHTRRSNSIASPVAPAASVASTPPGPRETILDRAFQMRCIPGGDRIPEKQEEKISSIARFEALMREADERKMALSLANQGRKVRQERHLEEESEPSSCGELDLDDELELSEDEISIPKPAQRALDYISGRRTPIAAPTSHRPRSPAPGSPPGPFLNPQAMLALQGTSYAASAGLRPRTGSTPSVVRPRPSRPTSLALPSRSTSSNAVPTLLDRESTNSALRAGTSDPKEKRRSSASVKRLSFSEFAKRLSSTSSLLLVQTMDSSSSGRDGSLRDSSDYGLENSEFPDRTAMRGGLGRDAEAGRDKRCGWRGSVFGADGGFL
ncbi:uncharacterized protein L3040_008548 [Drepanopeziza brunnea f. sp. 'multigermtubi']|uniref:Uncharacterized protein n=1 Tax=Marssonina brunnea f. sp. multigermtubi (strain MB_m1) TaxID=1072389 RepID=K1WTR3_MARBU|nr:uncharacterized protein MBM_05740 [Drepanopeziza brunnea f. sp. 'multigermtubi' MB_m1]EKD16446.1 hypothetical protein MBM_05740 [Drepanopeziza brunnea f. sp. 'multigermtubi' MB_m1]KAJ5033432.1 hypothetical protein L3040_008548 [Drepanopeziza brunnea f. sp. 'multigermtubi']